MAYNFVILKVRIYNLAVCYYLQNIQKALIIKGYFITYFNSLFMVTLTLNVLRNVSIMLNRRNKLSKHAKLISNKLKEFLISGNKVLWNICCWNIKYYIDTSDLHPILSDCFRITLNVKLFSCFIIVFLGVLFYVLNLILWTQAIINGTQQ